MSDFINNFRAIHHFIKGIFSNPEGEYTLTFVQDSDERWYIDMPWDGNRANLEMVAGADDLLSHFDKEGLHKVTLHVIPSEERRNVENHIELRQLDKSTFGGSHYDATDVEGFQRGKIWVCPVTLCVLGRYPKYLYIKAGIRNIFTLKRRLKETSATIEAWMEKRDGKCSGSDEPGHFFY